MDAGIPKEDVARWMPKLERIARELVSEPDAARDLVQDAWVEALQAKPRHPLSWMRVVMRRQSSRERGRERLRQDAEKLAAGLETYSDREAERASTATLVLDELHQLDSPYREVLRMRFLEELSVKEIAERRECSPETVRSQLHRGLERLRARLDRRAGSRDAWAGLLLGASRIPGEGRSGPSTTSAAPASVGPAAPSGHSRALLALAAVVSVGIGAWLLSRPAPDKKVATQAPVPEAPTRSSPTLAATRERRSPAALLPSTQPEAQAAPDLPSDRTRLVLHIEDAHGRPVPDAYVEVKGGGDRYLHDGPVGPEARLVLEFGVDETIDQFGMFGAVSMAAWSDELTRPDILGIEMEAGRERVVRVELDRPSVRLQGRVLDPSGKPLHGALLESIPAMIDRDGPGAGTHPARRILFAETDERGEFSLEGVVPEELLVTVQKPGFVTFTTHVTPGTEGASQDFTMRQGGVVAGFVSHGDGRPASGAKVWVGRPSAGDRYQPETRADQDGFFLMSGLMDAEWEVFACDPEDPSLFAWTRVLALDGEESPFEAVLRPTTGVRVRVLDREGTPFRGAGVVLTPVEPRTFWSAQGEADEAGRAQFLHVPDVPLEVRVFPHQIRGNGDPSAFHSGVRAGDPELTLRTGGLVGAPEEPTGRLRGTLLQSSGEPLAGAHLYAIPIETPPPVSPAGGPLLADGAIGTGQVGADGSFVLVGLGSGEHHLFALSTLPECAGAFDLGHHTLLPGETYDLGTRAAPAGQPVRIERATPGEVLLTAETGPYWHPWMSTSTDGSLELNVLDGTYWFGTRTWGAYFTIPGDAVVKIPE